MAQLQGISGSAPTGRETCEGVAPSSGRRRIEVVERDGEGYPEALLDLPSPPRQIFTIGHPAMLGGRCVSIVGTRNPTAYGLRMTRVIATALSEGGACIVSGMARGIDAAAHRAALEAGGATAAVLGTGIDVPYPVSHRELHQVIGDRGLLVSEHASGTPAYKGAFPRRNRIIAALAPVTIVVEAGARSGALNTANHALDLGRTVAALPGPIDSAASEGTNGLLRDGAAAITSVSDALALVGIEPPAERPPARLSENDARVWSTLSAGPLTVDAITTRTRLPARECLGAITSLEIAGMVECLVTGEVRRR